MNSPGARLLRLAAAGFGVAFFGLWFFARFSRSAISAGFGMVSFRFYDPFPAHWVNLPLAVVILLLLLVLAALLFLTSTGRRVWSSLRADRIGRRRYLVVLGLFLLTLMPLEYRKDTPGVTDIEMYVHLLFGSLSVVLLLYGLGRALDAPARWLLTLWRRLGALPARWFVLGTALFVLIMAGLIAGLVFHFIPHVQDSVAQVFQARLFARGRLFLPSPEFPEFFDSKHVVNNGRWFSQYPPGHPAVLTLGVLLGMPWIVNPLLGALTVIVIYYLGRELYDETTARMATLLATLSPFLVFMSSEYMNHSSALLFTALFILFYARTVRTHRLGNALLAGLCIGMVINIRPVTALFISVPFLIDAGRRLYRDRSRELPGLAAMALTGALMLGLLLLYNQATTGNPLLFGYIVKYGQGHGLGFNKSGWGEPYTVPQGIVMTAIELYGLNRFLFEFPYPSLVFLALLFAAGTRERWDCLLLGTIVMLPVGYFFYWWHSILFGPRWEFEALPALVLLTARGLRRLPQFVNETLGLMREPEAVRAGVSKALVLGYFGMLTVSVPTLISGYRHGFGVLHTTAETIRRANLKNAIVFARKSDEVFLHNTPSVDGDVIYVRDNPALRSALTRKYPGRRSYFAYRDTLKEIDVPQFDESPLKAGLDSIAACIERSNLRGYRTLVWPLFELRDLIRLPREAELDTTYYRELNQKLVGDPVGFRRYAPALAVWVLQDKSEGLVIFSLMDQKSSFIAGGYRFTYLGQSLNGRVVLFDIRDENDERPIPLPVPEQELRQQPDQGQAGRSR